MRVRKVSSCYPQPQESSTGWVPAAERHVRPCSSVRSHPATRLPATQPPSNPAGPHHLTYRSGRGKGRSHKLRYIEAGGIRLSRLE